MVLVRAGAQRPATTAVGRPRLTGARSAVLEKRRREAAEQMKAYWHKKLEALEKALS